MRRLDFLKKLKREGRLELVEPSEDVKASYLNKAADCLKSAKILFENRLYENATSEAYYCAYNSLLALLFKVGIKSESHSASIIVFDELFGLKELVSIITFAKEERIDKQYYVVSAQAIKATEESCQNMISKAEEFSVKIRSLMNSLNSDDVKAAREKFILLTSDKGS
ncbi:MAG: HEPN domain-containing protein [Candidatus Woesearchaeota archaeon]